MASRHGSGDHYYYIAFSWSHTSVIPSFRINFDIRSLDTLDAFNNQHGEQHTILLFAANRSARTVKIRQSSSTSDAIDRVLSMPYNKRTVTSTRFCWLIGESDQGSCSSRKGRLITNHAKRRNPNKSYTFPIRVEDRPVPLEPDLFFRATYCVEE